MNNENFEVLSYVVFSVITFNYMRHYVTWFMIPYMNLLIFIGYLMNQVA